ncbi:unnamed protein product [Amoebophrya sp. A25]|nr:unnamed protein product [Amoebophrya sp. A25]|eukprot:GSA25T00020355001.1
MLKFVTGLVLASAAAGVQAGKPFVELSVASPSTPFPQVSAAIKSAESARKSAEAAASTEIEAAFKQTLSEATVALGNTIAKALGHTSFANIASPTISVKMAKTTSDEGAGAAAVTSLEGKRAGAEAALVASAKKEFQEVAKVVIAEFDKQLHKYKGSSFVRFSREINVRLVSDPSYATIATMLQHMESHRDAGEARLRSQILVRELDLVKALNRVGSAALAGK